MKNEKLETFGTNLISPTNHDQDNGILDEAYIKKLVLILEKRILKNQELRIKYHGTPEKFMSSEIDLHDALQQIRSIATVPDLYYVLVNTRGIHSILDLLSHSNTDITIEVIDLIQEITDVDILNESIEGTEVLIREFQKQKITSLLVSTLSRLNESNKEEFNAVHTILSIFENLLEIEPVLSVEMSNQGLLDWLLNRIKQKSPFDNNKQYSR